MPPPPPPPQPHVEVMELTAASAAAQQQHQHMLLDLQAQRMASSMDVPTLPEQVRQALRDIGCPVRLFGENLANVRDRLRLELAKRQVYTEHYGGAGDVLPDAADSADAAPSSALAEAVQETQYSRANPTLVKAREQIATFSLHKAKARLEKESFLRSSYKALSKKRKTNMIKEDEEEMDHDSNGVPSLVAAEEMDQSCCQLYRSIQDASLAGSQYGDTRPLSAIATLYNNNNHQIKLPPCVLTASWSATLQWWDGSTPMLTNWGKQSQAHEDRIMGVALQTYDNQQQKIMAASASIDLTAKLWKIVLQDDIIQDDVDMQDDNTNSTTIKKEQDTTVTTTTTEDKDESEESLKYSFQQVAHLKGHEARLCKVAFHPMGHWVATTSHDYTWRLWDIETCCSSTTNSPDTTKADELLLQDGHADKVFGVDFHPDGSLIATTDYSGMIHVWDLRTGKTAMQYYGHAGRVLCAKFAPTNGFQMTTAGDDGCLKVWDLRHRRKSSQTGAPEPRRTIPAHSKLVTQLQYTSDDECLVSSSFDGSIKLWSTRGDWKLLQTLEGHEGKVMGVGIVATYDDNNSGQQKTADSNTSRKRNNNMPSDWGIVSCGFDHTLKLWR